MTPGHWEGGSQRTVIVAMPQTTWPSGQAGLGAGHDPLVFQATVACSDIDFCTQCVLSCTLVLDVPILSHYGIAYCSGRENSEIFGSLEITLEGQP